MSKQIDERVVEMRFDNRDFEKNISTTMSTLDKFKQKLNLSGAAKGLDEVNKSAKRVDMSGLGAGVEAVSAKFSAMQVIGVTALANITNSAVNAGKRMVKALTIDPVKTGFSEYETKINSIQTIMSNTASKGTTMADVTRVIDELNTYADKTIYNFAEMTRNIGTFTAAGVGLEESASAIQGIANLAAASGSTSQQASTAMYQLSQALAAGTVKLMDWNSVVDAGMGGEKFQEALKATARDHGIAVDALIEKNGSFRESLQEGWISADILNETLNKFTTKGAKEYAQAMMESGQWTQEQADALMKEALSMEEAATKVKTFTQLIDTLKESVQSGWGKTWEILIGDFEEAKEVFSGISNVLGGFIDRMSDWRNNILESALGNRFKDIADKINTVTTVTDKLKDATLDYSEIVNKVIGGEFGSGQSRWNKLTEVGYNWAKVQNLVNEQLGSTVRHNEGLVESQEAVNETQATTIEQLSKMNNAQLKEIGFTQDEIKAFRDLQEQAEKTGIPLKSLIDDVDQLSGRSLLINSFKNVFKGFVQIFKAVGDGWKEIFPPKSTEEIAEGIYNVIAAFHKFTSELKVSDDTMEKITRTAKGVFAILDIITTIFGGGLKIAIKAVTGLLGAFDLDILDVTASIGDVIVGFRDWIDSILDFEKIFTRIKDTITGFADAYLEGGFEGLGEAFREFGSNIVEGLRNGILGKTWNVVESIINLGKQLIEGFCEVLGIESPSKVAFEWGSFIIQGLIDGLAAGITAVINGVEGLGSAVVGAFEGKDFWGKIKEFFSGIFDKLGSFDYSKLLAIIPISAVLLMVKKIADVTTALADGITGFNDVIENFALIEKKFAGVLSGLSLSLKSDAIKTLAISLAILVGSVIALTQLADTDKLAEAVGTIVILAVVLAALAFAMDKMGSASISGNFKEGFDIQGIKQSLIGIGIALLLMAAVVKIIGSMNVEEADRGMMALISMMTAMGVFVYVCGEVVNEKQMAAINKIGSLMTKIAFAMLLMIGVMKLTAVLNPMDVIRGTAFATAFGIFIWALASITKDSNEHVSKIGGLMIKIALAMALMIGVVKLIGTLNEMDMLKGTAFAAAFLIFIEALMRITKIDKDDKFAKLGGMILAISVSMLLLVGLCKLVGFLRPDEMIKGGLFMAAFLLFVKYLAKVTTIDKEAQTAKLAGTLLAMSVAIGILAAISVLMSMLSVEQILKGVGAVTALGLVMTAMIWATRGANGCVGNLIVMTVAIGIMAAAVGILSTLDTKGVIVAAASLSTVMLVFAGIMKIASGMGKVAPTALVAMGMMVVFVGLAAVAIYKLAELPVEGVLGSAAALSILLLSMSAACYILAGVGPVATQALIGAAALGGVIAILGGVMVGLGYLMSLISGGDWGNIETGLDRLCTVFGKLGELFGQLIGGFIGGIAEGMTSVLPDIGHNLSDFMKKAEGFISGAQSIKPELLTGVKTLAEAILVLTGAGIIDGLMSFFGGESALDVLGEQLPALGTHIKNFATNLGTFDDAQVKTITCAVNAIKALAIASKEIDGQAEWTKVFVGDNGIMAFASQLPTLGTHLSGFAANLGTFDDTKLASISCASEAIKAMATVAKDIPNEGGWAAKILGENSIAKFGGYLPALGTNLNSFATNLGTFTEEQVTTVKCASEAISAMATAAKDIPNDGGWAGKLFGENSISTFGSKLPALGTYLKNFVTNLGTFTEEQVTTVKCAADAIAAMATASKNIDGQAEWAKKLFGDDSLSAFGEEMAGLGTGLKDFVTNLGSFTSEQVATVNSAINAVKAFATLSNADLGSAATYIPSLSSLLPDFATGIKNFYANLPSASSIDSAVASVKKIKDMVNDMADTDTSATSNFAKALGDLGKAGVDAFVNAFTSPAAKADVKKAAENLIDKAIEGMDDKKDDIKTAGNDLSKEAADGMDDGVEDAEDAGKDLGAGLITGINSKKTAVYNAGYALGQMAVQGEKDGQKSNSPSKLTMQAGKWLGEGLIVGMEKIGSGVYRAGSNLGRIASENISAATSKIAKMMDGDMDAQPTIRPVLDLSDIQSRAGLIDSLLSMRPSVGVLANISAANSMMHDRQNGGNDDVVSAINKLRKDLANFNGNSYSIGNISYNDDSSIGDAIAALVRAVIVEGRV